ncbi:MAG: tRNA guanosine(15) transglycosylase TgtA, partial [Candidatus Natronoplasma sp.]
VYGDIDIEPEEILRFQKDIRSDISTILDEFTEPDETEEEAGKKIEKTLERAERAEEKFGEREGHIAFPIQGSIYPDLRRKCGRALGKLNGDLYPIGGVVPLMEDYRFSELTEMILASKEGLGPMGPVHLFGAGHPMLYSLAVLLGCDLFDSSSYAKYAKRGDMMFPGGTKNLDSLDYLECECPVCTSHTVEELEGLEEERKEALLARHNLWISLKEIEKVKQAVIEGSLWELVERRVRAHPELLKTLDVLAENYPFLSRYEPRSRKKAFFYTGSESYNRPAVKRIKEWIMKDYEPPCEGPTLLFEIDENQKPYHRYLRQELKSLEGYSVNLLVSTGLGPIPLEMDEIYPIAQSIFPPTEMSLELLNKYKEMKDIDEIVRWEGEETLDSLSQSTKRKSSLEEMRVKTVADYQFCEGAGKVLSEGDLEFIKNRKGRIKNVISDGEHILSVRHYDGFFTLRKPGARKLWKNISPSELRVVVTEESAKYNSEGKNVFAKFVKSMSRDMKPGDEALVVTDDDELVAIARVFLISEEAEVFDRGLAARTREGFELDST